MITRAATKIGTAVRTGSPLSIPPYGVEENQNKCHSQGAEVECRRGPEFYTRRLDKTRLRFRAGKRPRYRDTSAKQKDHAHTINERQLRHPKLESDRQHRCRRKDF